MGIVYQAYDLRLCRQVAIKTILPEVAIDDTIRKRFEQEAAAVGRLNHPNVIKLYGLTWADGRPYMILELVEIASLEQVIQGGTLHFRTAAQIVEKIASAIQLAHDHNICHRDLKPGNILIDRSDKTDLNHDELAEVTYSLTREIHGQSFDINRIVPKVADFGLVKFFDESGFFSKLTQTETLLGTPGYMSPESVSGTFGPISSKVDVYGLGAILYACLTGKPPYSGNNFAEVVQRDHIRRTGPAERVVTRNPGRFEYDLPEMSREKSHIKVRIGPRHGQGSGPFSQGAAHPCKACLGGQEIFFVVQTKQGDGLVDGDHTGSGHVIDLV